MRYLWILVVFFIGPALADDVFYARQKTCNEINRSLGDYVSEKSGWVLSQQQTWMRGGTLTYNEAQNTLYQFWLATKKIRWQIRDAAYPPANVSICESLKQLGINRVDAILNETLNNNRKKLGIN